MPFFFQMKNLFPLRKKTLATAPENEHPCVSFFIGEISKWLKGVDCKSIRFSVRGFESLSHHHFKKPANADKYKLRGLFRARTTSCILQYRMAESTFDAYRILVIFYGHVSAHAPTVCHT